MMLHLFFFFDFCLHSSSSTPARPQLGSRPRGERRPEATGLAGLRARRVGDAVCACSYVYMYASMLLAACRPTSLSHRACSALEGHTPRRGRVTPSARAVDFRVSTSCGIDACKWEGPESRVGFLIGLANEIASLSNAEGGF